MKRTLLSIIALLLSLCMLLGACNETPDPENNDNNDPVTPPTTETTPEATPEDDGLFHKVESYMPSAVYAKMSTYLEGSQSGFSACEPTQAPLVSTDVFTLSDCRVKSISIPVYRTESTDENGDFTFSIYVLPNDWATLRTKMKSPGEPIEIKINAAAHGLKENKTVRKFINVNLTAYNIKLSATETLGFYNENDTLIPAQVLTYGTNTLTGKKYEPAQYMIDNWDTVGYYYYHSTDGFSITDNSLLFDFELDRAYESEAAYTALQTAKAKEEADYAAKLAAVQAAYGDKCFSLIGDSISTFNNVTNDPTNPAIAGNNVYYTINTTVYNYSKTYWGKLAADTGMDLCVINSYSGGTAYGLKGGDDMLSGSYELSTPAGKDPDVIFLYYGINDMNNSPSSIYLDTKNDTEEMAYYTANLDTGNLYQLLTAPNKTKTNKEIVEEWFMDVQALASIADYDPDDVSTVIPHETYITWEGAYALALQNMQSLYGDAEIFMFTLQETNHSSGSKARLDRANLILRALAEYFEVTLVDQKNSDVTKANCHAYSRDAYGLHPNGKGHAAITKLIVETLYEKISQD